MKTTTKGIFSSREEAGRQLTQKLESYRGSDAVVVGIPYGGVVVAATLAEELGLPLDVVLCRKIQHPGNHKKTIGSVAASEVFVQDCSRTIPQDYIYHQVILLRNAIRYERDLYRSGRPRKSLRGRTVIVVDEMLRSCDSIVACLLEITAQQPRNVIVAAPVVTAEAANSVRRQVDDLIFLRRVAPNGPVSDYFTEFPDVDRESVKALLAAADTRMGTGHEVVV